MVAKPLCPLYKNIIKPLDRARYPELRYVFGFKFALGTSTGISSVNAAAAKKNGKTYNMAGQEVSSSAKGLIIKNGKKYVK